MKIQFDFVNTHKHSIKPQSIFMLTCEISFKHRTRTARLFLLEIFLLIFRVILIEFNYKLFNYIKYKVSYIKITLIGFTFCIYIRHK